MKVDVVVKDKSVWLTQKALAELFGVQVPAINKHLKNIFDSGELTREAIVSKKEIVRTEGSRKVFREVEFYNLNAIIAVGYRVNSHQATQFRIWATKTLREFIIKGFVMDDARLKRGKQTFGQDYFDELLERIREIRANERRFYQKITNICALSLDYSADARRRRTSPACRTSCGVPGAAQHPDEHGGWVTFLHSCLVLSNYATLHDKGEISASEAEAESRG